MGLCFVEWVCRLAVEDGVRSPMTLWGSELIPKDARDLRAAGRAESKYNYLEVDPDLGWTISPGESVGEDVVYLADASGLRVLPDAPAMDQGGSKLRIAAFGDSFTHCDEVPFEDCWTHRIEQQTGARVFNAGVPGYGTDQAYLRYLEMREALEPDVVILGLMIGDIKRNVNIFRTFMGEWTAWTKPRFVLAGDSIRLINHPAASPAESPEMIEKGHPLLAYDWWYDPEEWRGGLLAKSVAYRFARARLGRETERPNYYLSDSEPTWVTARIVAEFKRRVEEAGGRFICLVIPSRPDLRYSDPVPWQPLLTRLTRAGVEIIDPTLSLRDLADSAELFEAQGHYGRLGNEVLAQALVRAIGSKPVIVGIAAGSSDAGAAGEPTEKDAIGLFDAKAQTFLLKSSNTRGEADASVRFGPPGSVPAMGDFDGDGTDTLGVYSPARGEFSLKDTNAEGPASIRFRFGGTRFEFVPLVGNWDGLGGDSVGLYSPEHGLFVLRNSNDSGLPDIRNPFGPKDAKPTLIPIAGNWSGGDSIDGIGLYNPMTGRFMLKDDPTTAGPADFVFGFGAVGRGLIPIAGDWDGDDRDNVGLYDPTERTFFLRTTQSDGPADRAFRFGPKGLTPVAGNFDGN